MPPKAFNIFANREWAKDAIVAETAALVAASRAVTSECNVLHAQRKAADAPNEKK